MSATATRERASVSVPGSDAEWLSIPATMDILGVGRKAVEQLIAEKKLTAYSPPRSLRRILKADVDKLRETSMSVASA